MQPVRAHATDRAEVPGEVLAVGFGQSAHQARFAARRAPPHGGGERGELLLPRQNRHLGVEHAGGADHHVHHADAFFFLLRRLRRRRGGYIFNESLGTASSGDVERTGCAPGSLCLARRGAHQQRLRDARPKLVEVQRAVIQRAGEPVPPPYEPQLPRAIAAVHGPQLREHHVRLVRHKQPLAGTALNRLLVVRRRRGRVEAQVVQERHRRRPGVATREVPGIVLGAGAPPDLAEQTDVSADALFQAVRLDVVAAGAQLGGALRRLARDRRGGRLEALGRRDVVLARPDGQARSCRGTRFGRSCFGRFRSRGSRGSRRRRRLRARFGFVLGGAPRERNHRAVGIQLQLQRGALVRRPDDELSRSLLTVSRPGLPRPLPALHEVAPLAALRVQEPLLENRAERVSSVWLFRRRVERQTRVDVIRGQTQPVEARDGRHDDRLVALQQRFRGSVSQRVEVDVDRASLLDVPPLRETLRNVEREVRDEELDAFFREVPAELARHLRGERLVGHHHQRRAGLLPRQRIHHVRHHEGLAGAGGAP